MQDNPALIRSCQRYYSRYQPLSSLQSLPVNVAYSKREVPAA